MPASAPAHSTTRIVPASAPPRLQRTGQQLLGRDARGHTGKVPRGDSADTRSDVWPAPSGELRRTACQDAGPSGGAGRSPEHRAAARGILGLLKALNKSITL